MKKTTWMFVLTVIGIMIASMPAAMAMKIIEVNNSENMITIEFDREDLKTGDRINIFHRTYTELNPYNEHLAGIITAKNHRIAIGIITEVTDNIALAMVDTPITPKLGEVRVEKNK